MQGGKHVKVKKRQGQDILRFKKNELTTQELKQTNKQTNKQKQNKTKQITYHLHVFKLLSFGVFGTSYVIFI